MAREKANNAIIVNATTHEIESNMEWSPEDEIQLFFALDGLKPVGVNRHFNMFFASERLCKSLNRDIPTQQIWAHLSTMYNLEMLEEIEPLPFPNDITDFALPEAEFSAYMSKKRDESEDKKSNDNSSDIVKDKVIVMSKSKSEATSTAVTTTTQNAKDMEKKIAAKLADLPKRTQKRTRGSISLESSSPSTTPPPVQKRRRI